MGSHVDDKLSRLNKCFAAFGTRMRPLARVDAHVAVQFPAVFKSSTAMRATVRFLLGVDPTVNAQILLDGKGFPAHLANKRTFA